MQGTIKSYDFFGNVVVVKFPLKISVRLKKKYAADLMKDQKSIKTVLEKVGKFKGRLRKLETRWIAGEKTKEVLYYENGCVFRFNIDDTYFSPRLSNERKELADEIEKIAKNKKLRMLVMFAGVAPYSIIIAKRCKTCSVVSVELNRKASKYAGMNVKLNKLKNVQVLQGDVKKVIPKLKEKFDIILMPRPQLKDSFLASAFAVSKKQTRIYYYDFCKIQDIGKIVDKIKKEAASSKKKIKILNTKKAGEIAPYKIRVRVDFMVS